MIRTIFIFALLCGLVSITAAQKAEQSSLEAWNEARLDRQRNFLIGLTSWGAANTISGGIGMLTASSGSEARSFHEMNLTWGAINSVLGVSGLIGVKQSRKKPLDFENAARELQRTRKVLLFNSGLDIGYFVAGAFIRERANRPDEQDANRLKGFGNSVMLQGAGLLVLDVVGYFYLGKSELQITPTFTPQGAGLGFNMTF